MLKRLRRLFATIGLGLVVTCCALVAAVIWSPPSSPATSVGPSSATSSPIDSTAAPTAFAAPTVAVASSPPESVPATSTPVPAALIVDVPSLLEKTSVEVKRVLGPTIEAYDIEDTPIMGLVAGGIYRDYQLGPLSIMMVYDRAGTSRIFQVTDGFETEEYAVSDWSIILPRFGLTVTTPPERSAPAGVHWDDYNGYFISIEASNISGRPVFFVQIGLAGYR